jgi:hypothetical protein
VGFREECLCVLYRRDRGEALLGEYASVKDDGPAFKKGWRQTNAGYGVGLDGQPVSVHVDDDPLPVMIER